MTVTTTTYLDLLTDAFYELGVYSPPQTVSAEGIKFACRRLNSMIDSWSAERLTMFEEKRMGPFQLTANQQAYLIGPNATAPNWTSERPIWIDWAGLVQTSGGGTPIPEYPVTVITDYEWAKTVTKPLTSSIPTALWYDRTYDANGNGTINIWPSPTVANQIALYCPQIISQINYASGLTGLVILPPGYYDFMMYHTAIRIAPAYGKTPSPYTLQGAATAMERVKNSNLRLNTLRVDDAIIRKEGGFYNYLNDSFNYR